MRRWAGGSTRKLARPCARVLGFGPRHAATGGNRAGQFSNAFTPHALGLLAQNRHRAAGFVVLDPGPHLQQQGPNVRALIGCMAMVRHEHDVSFWAANSQPTPRHHQVITVLIAPPCPTPPHHHQRRTLGRPAGLALDEPTLCGPGGGQLAASLGPAWMDHPQPRRVRVHSAGTDQTARTAASAQCQYRAPTQDIAPVQSPTVCPALCVGLCGQA
jgi:hypothetical protein